MNLISGVGRLAHTARAAWRIVWAAARRELAFSMALQAVGAAGLALQLLLGKELLAMLTESGSVQGLAAYVPLLVGLAAATVVATGVTAVVGERQAVLVELIDILTTPRSATQPDGAA